MGIKDFFKIKITNPRSEYKGRTLAELGRTIKLSDLCGKRICLDASGFIYSSLLALQSVQALTDGDGRPTGHINTIFNKIIQLSEAGIRQVWIFDNPEPNPIKKYALEQRSARRLQAAEADITEEEKQKRIYQLNNEHIEDIKKLLDFMGILWIEAPPGIEAEQYGAAMARGSGSERFAEYMASNDADVLAFGGDLLRIVSQKSDSGKSRKQVIQSFELNYILEEMGVDYNRFLQICAVLGTDFAPKTPRVGPATVIKRVEENKINFTAEQERAIKYFGSDISQKLGESKWQQRGYDREGLVRYLVGRGFNEKRVSERLDKYKPPLAPKNLK